MILAIKYCGGCNPAIDRGRTVERIRALLPPSVAVTFNLNERYDLALLVDGCAVGCIARDFAGNAAKVIAIAGESVMHCAVSEDKLPAAVLEEIRRLGGFYVQSGC